MGKGENAGCKDFLLFSQCFQKASSSRFLNLESYGNGLTSSHSWEMPRLGLDY